MKIYYNSLVVFVSLIFNYHSRTAMSWGDTEKLFLLSSLRPRGFRAQRIVFIGICEFESIRFRTSTFPKGRRPHLTTPTPLCD